MTADFFNHGCTRMNTDILKHVDPQFHNHNDITIVGGKVLLIQGEALEWIPRLRKLSGVFTDPPYSSGGMFRGDRSASTRDKYQGTGTKKLFTCFDGDNRDQRSQGAWLTLWLNMARKVCNDKATLAMFTDWRQLPLTTDAVQMAGWVWRGIVPWDKVNARPMPNSWRAQCEYIVHGSKGGRDMKPTKDSVYLPGVYRMGPPPSCDRIHSTQKPESLMAALLEITKPGDCIVDPFVGSGTTAVAALKTGRMCIGIESNPEIFTDAVDRTRAAVSSHPCESVSIRG